MKKAIIFLFLIMSTTVYSQLKEFYITCDPADFKKINDNYSENIYIPITLEYNGESWDDCRMRVRGDGTRVFPKKSLKVVFDGKAAFNGREKLNFNAEYEDITYWRSYMATRVMEMTDQICFDAEHVRVFLNGKYHGLFLMIENMDAEFLEANGLDPKGNLYKATLDGACLADTNEVYTLWEKKTNENSGREDLVLLIDSLNNIPDSDFPEYIKRNFNYDELINVLAVNSLMANYSTYYHNYYMYHDINNTGKWMFLPWDMDKIMAQYGFLFPYWRSTSYNKRDNPLLNRIIMHPDLFPDYINRLKELNETVINRSVLDPILDSLNNVLLSSVQDDKNDNIEDQEERNQALNRDKDFLERRYSVISDQIKHTPRQFKAYEENKIFTHLPTLRWAPAYSPNGTEIIYRIVYGQNENLFEGWDNVFVINDIKDTSFTLSDLEDGVYYWRVVAKNNVGETFSFHDYNSFEYRSGTELPCNISSDLHIKKENSPYILNCELFVPHNLTLKIDPGVEIYASEEGKLFVEGKLEINGSKSEPVKLRMKSDATKWGGIVLRKIRETSSIRYCEIINGNIYIDNEGNTENTVSIDNLFQYSEVEKNESQVLIHSRFSNLILKNSTIISNNTGEGVWNWYGTGILDNCHFINVPDSYEAIGAFDLVIKNNVFENSADDAIDCNFVRNSIIEDNIMMNSSDCAISLGWDHYGITENVLVRNNLMYNNKCAVKLSSTSWANLENNTFVNNKYGIYLHKKYDDDPQGITKAYAKNIIFYNCTVKDVFADDFSEAYVTYSLSNSSIIEGKGNIKGDPLFLDAENMNFYLNSNSPCINAGDPESQRDEDGTRADIGAYPYLSNEMMIVINEICYNAPNDEDCGDWVELYNNSESDVDISNWYFSDSDETHKFYIPENTVLKSKEYLVLVEIEDQFKAYFPNVKNYYAELGFGLSGKGEHIRLYNDEDIIVDSLTYDDKSPWPEGADGNGATLELINPNMDNSLAESWSDSNSMGTPGRKNDTSNISIEFLDNAKLYPNPTTQKITISVSDSKLIGSDIRIYDLNGKIIKNSKLNNKETSIDVNILTTGAYILRISNSNYTVNKYFIKK